MKVSERMSAGVSTCHLSETMDRAAEVMWVRDCGCVPVVDAADRVRGVITDRDVCMAAWSTGRALAELPVEMSMSAGAFCCRAEDDVLEALRMMREQRLRRLPVVDAQERLVGMLSLADLVQGLQVESGETPREEALELLRALDAVSAPRPASVEQRREEVFGREVPVPAQLQELQPVMP